MSWVLPSGRTGHRLGRVTAEFGSDLDQHGTLLIEMPKLATYINYMIKVSFYWPGEDKTPGRPQTGPTLRVLKSN